MQDGGQQEIKNTGARNRIAGTNKRGRPCRERTDDIVSWCKTRLQKLKSLAQDRRRWQFHYRTSNKYQRARVPWFMKIEEEEELFLEEIYTVLSPEIYVLLSQTYRSVFWTSLFCYCDVNSQTVVLILLLWICYCVFYLSGLVVFSAP